MTHAIEFDHVWKSFKRGERATKLRDALPHFFNRLTGKPANRQTDSTFWALKDISFKVRKGEVLGIIGPNGAGKTTILNLLAGIMRPNKGSLKVNGRISALIAVGAGFHPDLTGRENIYLNGAIMGMTRREIDKKFDSIVDFAGSGLPEFKKFIDTPVKRYSSGMYIRLGFSITTHVDPEILLVDEVLAVGDMAFVPKCLQRMSKLKSQGIPIVFVSHNMSSVAQLCTKAIYLDGGIIRFEGETKKVIKQYEDEVYKKKLVLVSRAVSSKDYPYPDIRSGTGEVQVVEINFLDRNGVEREVFQTGEKMIVRISFIAHKKIERPTFNIEITNEEGLRCIQTTNARDGYTFDSIEGGGIVQAEFPRLLLAPGVYQVSIALSSEDVPAMYDRIKDVYHFQVKSEKEIYGVVDGDAKWRYSKS